MNDGPLDAPLVLVGRDYGFEEARVDRPFVGAAGKLLDRALAKVGLRREELLVTNVVNKRPAGNKWEAHRDQDITEGLERLQTTLQQARHALVVALGAEAFQACRGHDPREPVGSEFDGNGITELRGYVFDGPFGPVLASTHPAFILRTWLPWWPCFLWDLAKAKRVVDGEWGRVATQEVLLDEGIEWPEPPADAVIAMDSETGKRYDELACVGWAWDEQTSYIAPYNEATRDRIAERLASQHQKVFMNLQFDATLFARNGLPLVNATEDIMMLWHCLEPLVAGKSKDKGSQTQKSLRFLMSIMTNQLLHKDYRFASFADKMILCGRDCTGTLMCYNTMRRMLCQRLSGANPATTSRPLPMTSVSPS